MKATPIPTLLGIDLGTSSVKLTALGTSGAVLGERTAAYGTSTPHPGWAEQEPDDWWNAVGRACRELAADADHGAPLDVVAIGVCGQMHTLVLLGADGRPIRPAVTWMDTRAEPLLDMVRETVATAGVVERLANPVVLGLTLPPLVWLREFEPAVLERARTLLCAKDELRFRLTGELGSEPTDASATLLCDVAARRWSPEVLTAFDLPPRLLPPLGESAEAAGSLTNAAAGHLGLRPGLPVAFGAGDQQAAAVGMGSVRAGQMQLTVGTGAQVLAVRDRAAADPRGRLHAFCHVREWVTQASVNNAGAALDWVRATLGVPRDDLYAHVGSGLDGPIFVPYLTGERTPLMKGHARGAWIGLSPRHTRGDLARAATEGVIAAIAEGIAAVLETCASEGPLRAAGGGLRSRAFAQGVADASQQAIAVREVRGVSGVGAALLAGVAVGAFADLDDAAAHAPTRIAAVFEPDPSRAERWRSRCSLLRQLDAIGLHEVFADHAAPERGRVLPPLS